MIGDNIKQIRISKQLTQIELAKRLGVSDKTVCSWEVSRTEPKMGMVEKIAKVLNCTKSDLIYDAPVLCAGGKLPEADIKYQEAVAYTLRKLKELATLKDAQNLNHLVQLYDRLDDIDKGKIIERIETMLEADKYQK